MNLSRSVIGTTGDIIIDTDVGGDDAVALLLTLQAEAAGDLDGKVIAITCGFGNTLLKNVEINVLKTLTIANRSDVRIFSKCLA